jgi:protein involved in polysaccharide export with SLBB domain
MMARKTLIFLLLLVSLLAAYSFHLAAGDLLRLSLLGEGIPTTTESVSPTHTGEYMIDPDGNVQLHLVGTMGLEGLTLEEARGEINEALSRYLLTPDVRLTLIQAAPRYIYVLGYIVQQRRLPIKPGDTILDAITQCGGEIYDARMDAIKVIRGGLTNPEIIDVDLMATLNDGDFSQNIAVHPGDIVYVPATMLYEWNKLLSRVLPSLSLVRSTLDIVNTNTE